MVGVGEWGFLLKCSDSVPVPAAVGHGAGTIAERPYRNQLRAVAALIPGGNMPSGGSSMHAGISLTCIHPGVGTKKSTLLLCRLHLTRSGSPDTVSGDRQHGEAWWVGVSHSLTHPSVKMCYSVPSMCKANMDPASISLVNLYIIRTCIEYSK